MEINLNDSFQIKLVINSLLTNKDRQGYIMLKLESVFQR